MSDDLIPLTQVNCHLNAEERTQKAVPVRGESSKESKKQILFISWAQWTFVDGTRNSKRQIITNQPV